VTRTCGPELNGDRILLAHGGGGELTGRLVREHLLARLGGQRPEALTDGAILPDPGGPLVFTTDSYVVVPLEFPGGDIGRLAVAGTVNDLAVMGAKPVAISLGLILEEGLPLVTLDRIVASIAATAEQSGVAIVTGDTKVIERRVQGSGDPGAGDREYGGLLINTAGIGLLRPGVRLGFSLIEPGDAVLLSGNLAEHGLAIMSLRHGIEFETELRSDVAPLHGLVERLFDSGARIRFLRDATRGGLAGVLADICEACGLSIEISEAAIPISPTCRHAAEFLGLDPLTVANEGKLVCVVASDDAGRALEAMRSAGPIGARAAQIGRVSEAQPPLVELITRAGGRRVVQRPYGEDLPRIC
jgi:hydrogenase expression/formation protein HypE